MCYFPWFISHPFNIFFYVFNIFNIFLFVPITTYAEIEKHQQDDKITELPIEHIEDIENSSELTNNIFLKLL